MKKYEPLGNYLAGLPATKAEETLSFARVEEIIGDTLPPSAHRHRQWWENQQGGSNAPLWQDAGFKVDNVDQKRGIVSFRRIVGTASEPGPAQSAEDKALEYALGEAAARANRELGIRAGRFWQRLRIHHGVETAQLSLQSGAPQEGFYRVLDAGRPELSLESIVLQERFRGLLGEEYLAEARRRLGWLEASTVDAVTTAIEEQANAYEFGNLQHLRQRLKNKSRLPSRRLFNTGPNYDTWSYHVGGRTELQFNVGFEEDDDGRKMFRHGVALSFQTDASFHQIDEKTVRRVERFNAFVARHEDPFPGFVMYEWSDTTGTGSGDHPVREIPFEAVTLGTFIFIGRRQGPSSVSTTLMLRDFDRLLPLYEFVEGGGDVPALTPAPSEPVFGTPLVRKPSSTTMTTAERRLNKTLRHNDIQYELCRHLRKLHGKDAAEQEYRTRDGTQVDVALRLGDEFTFYEIKVAYRARDCIRQALGQLLEYAYWPGALEARHLIIVGEPELRPEEKDYVMDLRKRFGLPVTYRQFDMTKKALV